MACELDKRGFVFIDDKDRPFWVGMWNKEPWMFYWHADHRWVSFRRVTQGDVFSFSRKRIEDHLANIYHRQHIDNGFWLDFDVPTACRTCRECGCTDDDCSQCIAATGHPCHWVEPDLCGRCQDELAAARPLKVGDKVLMGGKEVEVISDTTSTVEYPEVDEFQVQGPGAAR